VGRRWSRLVLVGRHGHELLSALLCLCVWQSCSTVLLPSPADCGTWTRLGLC
jgi:hypothetical protein